MWINAIATNVKEKNGKLELVPDAKTTISFGSDPHRISRDKHKEDISRQNDRDSEPIINAVESEVTARPKRTVEEQEDDLII